MGALDQFAKLTFAEDTERVTGGAAAWSLPPEIGLTDVRLDGMILVRDSARLTRMGSPWEHTASTDEICVEVKMQGDHNDATGLERAMLRRQARQVQRMEEPQDPPWDGQVAIWMVTSRVPGFLKNHRVATSLAPGVSRVTPSPFPFLWIAANKLPLRDDLVPFLVARSGSALDEFVLWVKDRRPRAWVLSMVQILPMTTAVYDDMAAWLKLTDEPEVRARQRRLARDLIAGDAELEAEVQAPVRLAEARRMLSRFLAGRKLVPSPAEQARIDGCADLQVLERWGEQASAAATVAEALR